MNFFEHQDAARKKTGMLVTLLVAAVSTLIAITVFAVGAFWFFLQSNSNTISAYEAQQVSLADHFWRLLHSPLTLWISLVVILVVTIGCLYKFAQLGRGGKAVAEALGGRLIDPDSRDPAERKVLNVVEEMAIASGNPVPQVYLLEDSSINAFAAGLDRRDAIIGVTRACSQLLSRDELQGVIAHEFSHIHNGDMRLNMRLIAILHGILLIGLIGYAIAHGSGSRISGYRRRDGRQVSLGLALMAIGYGGTFFGNLIKAAISRQREFLADASAVQFTRNPGGISGALKKIGGLATGSLLSSSRAAEFSHLYFGQGIKTSFNALMATHPPLRERIQRIEPQWSGSFPTNVEETIVDVGGLHAEAPYTHFSPAPNPVDTEDSILNSIGEPRPNHIEIADRFIEGLPTLLHEAAHQSFSARALIYGLLLDRNREIRARQLGHLKNSAHPATYRELNKLLAEILRLPRQFYLPLVNLSIPALKNLSARQYDVFKANLSALIKADKRVTLFEWCLYRITVKNIEAKERPGRFDLRQVKDATTTLLIAVTIAGKNAEPIQAFNKGASALGLDLATELPARNVSLPALDSALGQLELLRPLAKPKLLKGLLQVISADKQIRPTEKELFCAVADTLNCPVPPLV